MRANGGKRLNCRKNFPQDFDSLSEDAWWTAEYKSEKGMYYPGNFRWPECPISALTGEQVGFDPVEVVNVISDARSVGGRGGVFQLARRDARLFDAASICEGLRSQQEAALMKAGRQS